ncbi:helix-turn-helix domain-containing protein [Mycobacteroides abscessus]|uniref:helix-turn-helix domain-containing protein n=1 Tax=Mycobacteroides abscessus TaxID=36809 RepID=UPI00070DA92B|nr:helix-turn-helix domain-containing protein [Mycobacteroides abscessus]ALM19089.1 hypothetical protein AOY11_25235 [Mycobacteroides abscessus]AMU49429.1 hypothetical protein A3O01_04175 [Mycobacteroides abscessus]ANO08102.1 hypothetical protein BAB76_04175 [Mycobacteroides abscessus]MDM3921171.1 hypothetical protein [Mycobacteroides abscessus]MDO2964988.1 hypothetical protein [Mycobacteroides abscessus subsp. abscessus]
MTTTTITTPLIVDGVPVLEVPPRTAAVMKSVSERSILRWIAEGKLPARRLPGGRQLRIAVADLTALGEPV